MNAIPLYGKVVWKDATSFTGRKKQANKKELPIVASVGRLFIAADGTLAIFHEYQDQPGVYQRDVEATFIPAGWYTQIIPLTEPADSGSVPDKLPT